MSRAPTVEILAIGDELLSGEVREQNAFELDRALHPRGLRVVAHHVLPDDVGAIEAALVLAAARSDVVLTTGGLGPTIDDLTVPAVARAAGVPLELHDATLQRIEARLAARGRIPTDGHRRMARVPRGAEVLVNEAGTAPGLRLVLGTAQVFVLPGVPREMRWLFEHRVAERLPPGVPRVRRLLRTAGIGESAIEARLAPVMAAHPEIRFGFRARLGRVDVKLLAEGEGAVNRVAAAAAAAIRVLGDDLYGEGEATIEGVLVEALAGARATVAAAESCTGGLLLEALTRVPGSSRAVLGGVVAYDNRVKVVQLGVPEEAIEAHGAVSEPVARAMADGVRRGLGATYGVGITGVAGPGGGTADKPVGTVWTALAGPEGTLAHRLDLSGLDREAVREATVAWTLDRLRRCVAA